MGIRRQSIRKKIIALVVATSASALTVAVAFVILRDAIAFRTEMKERTVVIAQVVGEYVTPELSFLDQEAAARGLAKLRNVPTVISASLFDDRGELFASYGLGTTDQLPSSDSSPEEVFFEAGALHAIQPIVAAGEWYGTIYLQVSTEPLKEKIRFHLFTLLGVVAILVFLAWLVARRWERAVSEPILELAQTAREITLTGDYTVRVQKRAEDEIGVLCDGFNDMLEQILERERQRDEAEHRTREKSRFLANMSHELRTPLNSIIGFSELLQTRTETRLEPKERKFLRNIHTSGRHLLAIINDILDISKVEAGRMELHPEPVSVPALVDGVTTVMKAVADRAEVTIRLRLSLTIPVILADLVKLKQILYNLVANAVKFSPAGREVVVEARVLEPTWSPLGEESVEIAVIDQGIGIAEAEREQVFQAFHQSDPTAGRLYGGTGLGLALVKTFTEMHGGRVDLESTPGRGSTFRVVLPVRGGLPAPESEEQPRPSILVVEDERTVAAMITEALAQEGFDPILATNGEAALELARRAKPAAVILDLVLPGAIDGWDVLRRLKAEPTTALIPIVIYSRIHGHELGMALGADDYFLKPVDLGRLVQRLRQLIEEARTGPEILLVDDDRATHNLLDRILGREGFRVTHVYSPQEAIGKIRAAAPGLVVIDLTIESMEGLELALELRSRSETARVPIVLLTNQSLSDRMRTDLLAKGVHRFERGALGGPELIRVLRGLLTRHP